MKATALLEDQHREVEAILEALGTGANPLGLMNALASSLAAHMAIEQNVFYPTIAHVDAHLVEESFEEHAIAELALKRLLKTPPSDGQFAARLSVLRRLVHRHFEDEEEDLFPSVEIAVPAEQLEALGKRLEVAFLEAQREGFDCLVPGTFSETSADEALKLFSHAEHIRDALDGSPNDAER